MKLNIGGPGSKAYKKRKERIDKIEEEREERILQETEHYTDKCPKCKELWGVDFYLHGTCTYVHCRNPNCDYLDWTGVTCVVFPPEDDPWWDLPDEEHWVKTGEWVP